MSHVPKDSEDISSSPMSHSHTPTHIYIQIHRHSPQNGLNDPKISTKPPEGCVLTQAVSVSGQQWACWSRERLEGSVALFPAPSSSPNARPSLRFITTTPSPLQLHVVATASNKLHASFSSSLFFPFFLFQPCLLPQNSFCI